jgi:sterol desaturase/sphingolipid hydroxylase (fatty acid hydroxylase superfamily)
MGFTATQITLLFITGMISYTLIEYLMHRYIYHIRPYTEAFEKFSYKVHGVHHEYPKDKKRLVMPPVPALVLTAFFSCFRTCDGGVCLRFPARFYHGLYHLSGHTLQCSCL